MPTFRYFVAVGVGAAITLSFMEPSASKDAPSRPIASSKQTEHQETQPNASIPKPLPSPPEASQVEFRVEETNANSLSGIEQAATDNPTQPVASSKKTEDVEATADGNRPQPSDIVIEPVEANRPLPEQGDNQTREQKENPARPELLHQPSPLDGTQPNSSRIAQTSNPANVPTPALTPQPSVPAFLNPSSNPLLFPTQSDEVQVEAVEPVTLGQALELARQNNRELEAARQTLERSRYALQEALAAEYPSASLRVDFTRSESASANLQNRARADNPLTPQVDTISTTLNGLLELSYNLYTAGRRPAAIRASEEQVRVQQLEVERLSEELRLNVSNAYYDLQEADAQVEISQAAVTDAAQSLRDAQLLEQAGLGTRFDVLQAQVQLANANQDLVRARSQQRIARRQLVQLLNLDQQVEVAAADPIEVAGDWELSLEQSIVLAYRNRAELEQQLAQRNISEQQRRIALAATRPQVSVFANYNLLGSLDDDLGPGQGFALGARLQWNFYEGGAARARARQEEINGEIAETRFADQLYRIRFQVEQAFFSLNANEENIQTASFALEQAQESLRLARLRFQAGVGTQADVITQQTELTRARGNRLNAILEYNRALAQLQRAVSNLPDGTLFDLP